MHSHTTTIATILVSAALAAGCATAPVPASKIDSASASVRMAQELRADDPPAAHARLKIATDELAQAQMLMDAGEHEKASRLLDRAEADAELAIAIAQKSRSERALASAQADVHNVNSK
ncbi:MAG: DUF4398 domain-containing protein [Polyangiaceae bacterium]